MEKECQEKLNVIYYGLIDYWQEIELNDPNSIFYTEKFIEKEFKQLCPRAGETTLKILKAIKFSIIEKGKCYYTERELAKHFKINRQAINKILKVIAKTLNTEFIKIPTNNVIKTRCKSNSSYKQILIPPKLYKKMLIQLQIPEYNETEGGNTSGGGGNTSSNLTKDFNKLQTLPIYKTLYKNLYVRVQSLRVKYDPFLSYNSPFGGIYKKKKNQCDFENEIALHPHFFEEKPNMKPKLKTKPNLIINFDSYGLKPYKFLDHVEVHRELFKWLNILIDNNVAPKIIQTKMFLQVWNNFGNPRFVKHNVNIKSNTFKYICIALTYRMWSENLSFENIEKAIENFNTIVSNQGRMLYVKKINCIKHFLWNSRTYGQKDYFMLSILDEHCVLAEYYCKQLPPDKSFEVVRKLFGYIFYKEKPKEGKKEFKKYYKPFIDFTNEMIENHRTKKMCKFGEYNTSLEGFEDYIFSYFSYCYRMIKNSENPFAWKTYNILDMHSDFVLWLSNQKGWEGFMEDKKPESLEEVNEEPTKKLKRYKLLVKKS